MKVMVLGTRGFPQVQGGVETHAEHLYPRLAKLGCEIHVIARSPYVPRRQKKWEGVFFHRLWSPKATGLEAFLHSFIGVLYAGIQRPDILHIHAVGPALMTPLARLLGIKVVITHHGADYEREKWGSGARLVLRMGERMGVRYASRTIVISKVIQQLVLKKYGASSALIPNGVILPDPPATKESLVTFSLTPNRYVLLVSRFVPEKRQLDLIAAFNQAKLPNWKLVLVGGTEPRNEYVDNVLSESEKNPNIVVTGFQSGQRLQELFSNAGLFVLPSSHEGLPIAMLEALSYGLTTLASNIPANTEVGLPAKQYYPLGDIHSLSKMLTTFSQQRNSPERKAKLRTWVKEKYDWDTIAGQTLDVYRQVMN